jgi:para-nitrobenzyl esterase
MRKTLLTAGALASALLACGGAAAQPAAPVIHAPAGTLRGIREGRVEAFLGVPFAAAPVGRNRWRAPQPAAGWTGVRDARRFGASCYQSVGAKGFGPWTHEYVVQGEASEDCLYLNVWTTGRAGPPRPVLVWIHGGGFSQGSGSVPIYDGANLAGQGVVVVTINYRLGVFGFLAHPELTADNAGGARGNFGLEDMVAALRWVRANISAFGGDPNAVTIAGQSAGAMAVHDLVVSPMAKGLFQRAIAESGLPSTAPAPPLAEAQKAGAEFARAKGAASLAELRALTPEQLTAGPALQGPRFFPIADGVVLPASPAELYARGAFADTPMLVGLNADEGSAMSPGYGSGDAAALKGLIARNFAPMADRFAAFYPASTEAERGAASKAVARDSGLAGLWLWARDRIRRGRQPVYAYQFTHAEPGPQAARYGAFHSAEIPYALRTLDKSPERPFTGEDRALSLQVSGYWLAFIRTGDPNGGGRPAWPKLAPEAPKILSLGEPTHARALFDAEKLEAVNALAAAGGRPGIF